MAVPDYILNRVEDMRRQGVQGLDSTPLWLDAAWRAAQVEGIEEEEFIHWMEIGLWNLVGDPSVLEKVGVYRMIAGDKGWILGKANMSTVDALETYYEYGSVTVLNNAKTLLALLGLVDTLPESDRLFTEEDEEETPPVNTNLDLS